MISRFKRFLLRFFKINYHLFRQTQLTQDFGKSAGFTIIEMLVTLSIVMLLTLMVINYSRRSESLTNLIRESERIIFNLKFAQSSSMLTLGNKESTKICGWGVFFDKDNNKYILFNDLCPGNQQYDGGAELIENVDLLKGIILSNINFKSIVFIPPNPNIVSDPKNIFESGTNAQVTICLPTNEMCINIIVTPTGLIYKTSATTTSASVPPSITSTTLGESSCQNRTAEKCSCTNIGNYCSGYTTSYSCPSGQYCCCSGGDLPIGY